MPPENQIYNSYNDASQHRALVYIPSPYSLSAASYLQHSLDHGIKRKREEEDEDKNSTNVDLCFSLLQTSMCKLQKTQTVTSGGKRKSTSLRRSVLIFNMVNSLQNNSTVKSHVKFSQSGGSLSASSLVVDNSVADEESVVSLDSWDDKCDSSKSSSFPLTTSDSSSETENDRNMAMVTNDGIANSVECLDSRGDKSEIVRLTGQDLEQEMNAVSSSWLKSPPITPESEIQCVALEESAEFSVPQTDLFLSDEVFDLEASLFEMDYFDPYPLSGSSGFLKTSMSPCGRKLELFDGDMEFLMQVLANS